MYQVPEETLRAVYALASEYVEMLTASPAECGNVLESFEKDAMETARIILGVNHEGERG